MRNIEVAAITSESSQISIEHDLEDHMIIRPGKKVTVKVTVTAQIKEPVSTVITFQLKNGYKLLYLVRFTGIENSYGLEPIVMDKARKPSNLINFVMHNRANEELELLMTDIYVDKATTPVTLFHVSMRTKESLPDSQCDDSPYNVEWYQKLTDLQFKIEPKKRKAIFKMQFNDDGAQTIDYVVHFTLRDLNAQEKRHYVVPVYILINENEVDLYPSILDFGVLYSNSGIFHKLPIRVKSPIREGIRVGYPFVPIQGYFEYDFTQLVANHGVATPENAYLLGTVVLKTHSLKDGDYSGHIIFCKDKVCSNDEGKSRIYYRFTIAKDPLNAKSKMHSFEVAPKNLNNKKKSFQIQLLWLKNTFHYPIKIDDITVHDKELSLTYMVSKKVEDVDQELLCCVSSFPLASEDCKGCKTFIHETATDLHKVTLQPEDENEDIKIRYEYHLNKSRTIEVKFITVWTNGTYIPIPVFIYDKSLGCAFEYYSEVGDRENPFTLSVSQ